jgi:hypothetical protein
MDNIKADLAEVGCVGVDLIGVTKSRDMRRAHVNAVLNLWVL